jgi:hypothetical protein
VERLWNGDNFLFFVLQIRKNCISFAPQSTTKMVATQAKRVLKKNIFFLAVLKKQHIFAPLFKTNEANHFF